jgi:5S rRNA maturation endonuclease (ribonuclease M5)
MQLADLFPASARAKSARKGRRGVAGPGCLSGGAASFRTRTEPRIVATYDYQDEQGKLLFQTVRFEPKDFRQRRPDGNGGWIWGLEGIEPVLFRLPETTKDIREGLPVFLCEGEKDVLALVQHGLAATCNPMGAKKWRDSYSETLLGADVIIIADKDQAGREHAQLVVSRIYAGTKCVRVIELPDVNRKSVKDAADYFEAGGDVDQLIFLANHAPEWRPEPLIQFKSPLELKNFVPPPDIILVGDCHITQGTVFVIGGPPGVGKSRALVALGVAGATKGEWFGSPVHRRFKTMIVQTENGQFRLSKEFSELDCEALENYVRICTPPPYGLCFKREDFRKQLADAIGEFKPDIVGFDPWNAAAREQDSKEYLDTFDALKSVLPRGDDAPVLGIVAHTRKPKSDERHSGRSLLNLLAGSYVLGSVPRTVFIMQAASDDVTDNRVVWTCCKNNDGELGDRSAWERRNGLFVPVEFFDWDAFDHPPKERRGLKPDMLREFLMRGKEYDKGQIVSIIMKETGRGKTAAYDLVDEAKRDVLRYHKLTKTYELI